MEPFVRKFIRASLFWLGAGVLMGVLLAFRPELTGWVRPAHAHANLLGFVSMMIFGVAYHVIPRFAARPLHRPRLAGIHVWVANSGLGLLVGGWLLRIAHAPSGMGLVHTGAIVSAVGAGLFIYNIWRTLGVERAPREHAERAARLVTLSRVTVERG